MALTLIASAKTAAAYYDPYDLAIDRDPYPTWRRLRNEQPLYYNARHDFFALSRYDDVERCLTDWRCYSSAKGTLLELAKARMTLPPGSILFEDPPDHGLHRARLARVLSPKTLAVLEPELRALCARLLDAPVARAGLDFAELGAQLARWTTDRLTQLLQTELGAGEDMPLSVGDVVGYVSILSATAEETTKSLFGWAGKVLAEHPEQRAQLAREPALIPAAIEELLRFESPSAVQARYVTEDVVHYGQTVPQGSIMLLLTAAANRDERRFTDANRFDIHREPNHHLAFGAGVHRCLGAALARLEARIALEEVLARLPHWEVDWPRAIQAHTSTARGWHALPVKARR